MSRTILVTSILLSLLLCACGGDAENGDGGLPAAAGDPLDVIATNTATVECEVITADDLAVDGCNKVVNVWLITLIKRPYSVVIGLPSIEAGTYEADGGGQGLAITVSNATDLEDIQKYGINKLKVVLEVSDGEVRGRYEGEVNEDYVRPIPIKGVFKFDRSKVSE